MALLVYLSVELLSCGVYAALEGESMSLSMLQTERKRRAAAHQRTQPFAKKVREGANVTALHPFTGYVNSPNTAISTWPIRIASGRSLVPFVRGIRYGSTRRRARAMFSWPTTSWRSMNRIRRSRHEWPRFSTIGAAMSRVVRR